MTTERTISEKDKAARAAVGQTIRQIRRTIEPSQERFAHQAGLDRSFYGRVERGSQNIALSTLCTIAEALNVHPSELLKNIAWPNREPADRNEGV